MEIPFNKPYFSGLELEAVRQSFINLHTSGCGPFTKKAESLLCDITSAPHSLLTTSCTHALEVSAILLNLAPGDEVIVPSYTFATSALAFMMHGATPVFCDIRPDTLNIDESLIENLITPRTKAIVVVHYAGVGCEMDKLVDIANTHNVALIEDNAHGLFGTYNGKPLGTFGSLATQSFHETKNISCGEGGALLINDDYFLERAEIIREKGTNRSKFSRGQIDKYTWIDRGSSYVMSDTLAAILTTQLTDYKTIQSSREALWTRYNDQLSGWAKRKNFKTPYIPESRKQSFHMFYLLAPSPSSREKFIAGLKKHKIAAVFHYTPLHNSPAARQHSNNITDCPVTIDISERLVRLPFYTGMEVEEQEYVIEQILLL